MANINIEPFGQNAQVPEGYPIADDLSTNSAQQALSAKQGKRLKENLQTKTSIVVAAYNAPNWQKDLADFVCDGTNDELTIQQGINALSSTGGRLRLTSGTFMIESFPKTRGGNDYQNCALLLPQENIEIIIDGDVLPYAGTRTSQNDMNTGGTWFMVSETCYEGLSSSTKYCIIGTASVSGQTQINSKLSMRLHNVHFRIPWNQKKIMCVDCLFINRVEIQYVTAYAFMNGYDGKTVDLNTPVDAPIEGCIGIRSLGGSNFGIMADFKNICAVGFYEGFALAGEHVVCINVSAIMCHYGYTFGNFTFTSNSQHDMTLINCCDERNMCGPYFADCTGNQCVTMIGFNMEVGATHIPGGVRIQGATEGTQGKFRGRIDYTIMGGGWSNTVNIPFWEDGHGHGFISRNMAHLPACGTTTRRGYAPDYLERIFDTDLGKEVICTNEATKEWRDTMGNIV